MRVLIASLAMIGAAQAQVAPPAVAELNWVVTETAAAIKKCPKDFRVRTEYRDVFKFKLMDFYRESGVDRVERDFNQLWQSYTCRELVSYVREKPQKFIFLEPVR